MKPFFALPLDDFASRVKIARSAVRTLPPEQLAAEMATLQERSKSAPGDIALGTMLTIYRDETSRRSDMPEFKYADELGEVLTRLEGNTNEPDRRRLREIGEDVHRAGGTAALARLTERAVVDQPERKASLRRRIMQKWWRGLLPA